MSKNVIINFVILTLLFCVSTSGAWAQDELKWHSFEKALAVAEENNRPVFIDVWAPWCGWCRKMKKEVYPKLASLLDADFVATRLNRDDAGTSYTYKNRKLSAVKLTQQFKVQGVPAIILLSPSGDYLLHLSGFIAAEALEPVLDYISTGAYKTQPFDAFKKQYSAAKF